MQASPLPRDHERPYRAGEFLFRSSVLDERDHLAGPVLAVFDSKIVAIDPQKMPKRLESCPLISLLERVGSRDASHQHDPEHEDVFLAKPKEVPGTCHRAFEQPEVPHEMPFSRRPHFEAVVLDHRFDREPCRFIWQGRLGFSGTAP